MDIKKQIKITGDNLLPVYTLLLNPFITQYPIFSTAILTAYGFFGIGMEYKQPEMKEYLEAIKENIDIFIPAIVESKEFQDGFILITEAYIKERNEEKRKFIKNILLGFTTISEDEKKELELEKFLDILNKVSSEDIEYIEFLKRWEKDLETNEDERHIMKYLESLGLLEIKSEIIVHSEVYEATSFKDAEADGDIDSTTEVIERVYKTKLFDKFISYILEDE